LDAGGIEWVSRRQLGWAAVGWGSGGDVGAVPGDGYRMRLRRPMTSSHCWQRNGFQVVGTLPGAFHHKQLGYVDALVMIQALVEDPIP